MHKLIYVLLICLITTAAHAGSITFSATPGGLTKTQTLTDAEISRIIAWARAAYGQICDAATPPVCRERTNAEAFDAVASGLFRRLRDNVYSYERELARKAPGDAVQRIGVP